MLMNYADRFYFQVTFPILLFFLIAEEVARAARIACILAAILVFAVNPYYLREELRYYPYLRNANVDLGKRLAPYAANHTLFTGDAGAIPYYSNWFTYDFFGLGTNQIAREGVTLTFMQQHHPDLILIESPLPDAGLLTGPPPGPSSMWSGRSPIPSPVRRIRVRRRNRLPGLLPRRIPPQRHSPARRNPGHPPAEHRILRKNPHLPQGSPPPALRPLVKLGRLSLTNWVPHISP